MHTPQSLGKNRITLSLSNNHSCAIPKHILCCRWAETEVTGIVSVDTPLFFPSVHPSDALKKLSETTNTDITYM